ncbi:calcium ATPase [Amniculicola lignicola CBS 123094]|uniref:Calcium ATPase n=1 Tax=Amniculicola lignicola CBS 123094 TaxID=1392246 RepID=A0A6A5WN74_9PLEO|nr:calcium ATPase [Amniculicola lignicola CBS 123094]
MDEYTALQKYIMLYRDPRSVSEAAARGDGEDAKKSEPWWAFWRSGTSPNAQPQDQGVVPDSWLDTDIRRGIAASEVEPRRKRFGWNEITTEKENMLKKFLGFFTGPILYVMEIAALLAAGLADWVDFGVICGILLLNAIVGWYQEKAAADVVASLKGDIAMKATLVRDGEEQSILAREIVPGDIIILEEGQTCPADCRLICNYDSPDDFATYLKMKEEDMFSDESEPDDEKEGDDYDEENPITQGHPLVACDQSAITGESLAVDKYIS